MCPAPRPTRSARAAAPDPRLLALAEDSGYTIRGRIGAGGMGIVYRAEDADGNDVAIKLLRHEIADDPLARERLAREVAAQRLVRNPSVVRILDAELEDGDAFVVTEFIDGPTLEDAVRGTGGLHPEAVRELGLVLGETLRDIHAAGVVHRDLKPTNVMLRDARPEDFEGYDPDGAGLDPVIIDFGIAIAAEESRLTSTGLVMGTAAYLDPEVVRTNHTGRAADWWALAALLAFAATGREPYGSGRADIVFLRAERGEIDLDGVPVELAAWLRSALRSDPEQRPDPLAWIAELEELDLTRYEDPGETEGISAAAPATEVLPVAAAPEGPSTPADPEIERGAPADPETEVLPVVRDATMPLPVIREEPPARPAPMPQRHQPAPPPRISPAPHPAQRPGPYRPTPPVSPQPFAPAPAPPGQQMAPYPYDPYRGAALAPMRPAPPVLPPPPRRSGLVWLGHLLLVALGAVAPYMALLLLLLLGASARTWERTHRQVGTARLQGRAASPAAAGLAAAPRFLLGLLEMALQAFFPLLLGLLVGIAADAGWTLLTGSPPADGVAFGTALAITVLITWVGLGSRLTRAGAHRLVDAAAPDGLWTAVVALLLVMLLAVVLATILARDGMVDYFPWAGGPRLEDLAFWRR